MKKLLIALSIIAIATSCNNGKAEQEKRQADSLRQDDSIRQAESARIAAEYAAWQADSAREVDFYTVDIVALEARGHVKKIVEHNGNNVTYNFSESGRLTSARDSGGPYDVTRQGNSLHFYALGAGTNYYNVDMNTGRLVSNEGGEGGYGWSNYYNYDSQGNLISIRNVSDDYADDTHEVETSKVEILARDAHGNWLQRRVGSYVQSRSITYYPNPLDTPFTPSTSASLTSSGNNGSSFAPLTGTYNLVGKIGGDGNCVLALSGGTGSYEVSNGARNVQVTSYDQTTGHLVISAYLPSGKYVGQFDGTYQAGTYQGTFTNYRGGHVTFNLSL